MAETLTYDFRVVGLQAINRALASVERRFGEHNRRMTRTAQGGGGGTAATRTATATGAAAEERRRQQMILREQHRANMEASKADLKRLRDRERAERLQTAAVEREARRRARVQVAAEVKAANARAAYRARTVGMIGTSAGRAVRGVGRMAMMSGSILGGIGAVAAVQSVGSAERKAAMLANKAFGTPGETRTREQIKEDVTTQAKALGVPSGLGTEGIIAALDKFVAISGNLGLGQRLAPFMANVTQATGADVADVGLTAGQIAQNLMARPGATVEDTLAKTKDIMLAMAGQAKVGSIEFADLATQMGKVMSATNGFEGEVGNLANTMGGMAQLAIAGGASSAEEAMTSIKRFRDDLIQNQARFARLQLGTGSVHGVSFFTDKNATELRDPMEIINDIMRVTKGSLPKAQRIFGIRSMKAFEPFQAAFVKGGGLRDPNKGIAALEAVMTRVRTAKMTEREARTSAAFARETGSGKLDIELERFKSVVGNELLPELTDLIPQVSRLTPAFGEAAWAAGKFVGWAAQNPLQGVGAIVGAKVAADLSMHLAKSFAMTTLGSITIGAAGGILIQKAAWWKAEEAAETGAEKAKIQGEAVLAQAQQELSTRGYLTHETATKVKALKQRREEQAMAGKRLSEEEGQLWGARGFVEAGVETLTSVVGSDALARREMTRRGASDIELQKQAMDAQRLLEANDIWQRTGASFSDVALDLKDAAAALKGSTTAEPNRGNSPTTPRP